MNTLKILSLRDLAIAHYPKAQKMRADAMKFQGGVWADSGLTCALTREAYDATAVEKAAHELLQLTVMHPDAQPIDPFPWDAVEDAEIFASKARRLEQYVEMQPQIEAAMLDAARLLCELAGVALPPWVDAADAPAGNAPKGEDVTTQKRQRQDALAVKLDEILVLIETRTPANIMAKLREQIGKQNTCILRNVGDGIEWENDHGDVKTLTIKLLGERIREWKKTGLSQG